MVWQRNFDLPVDFIKQKDQHWRDCIQYLYVICKVVKGNGKCHGSILLKWWTVKAKYVACFIIITEFNDKLPLGTIPKITKGLLKVIWLKLI